MEAVLRNSVLHVVERAAKNREKEPRKQSGQGSSAANKQPPPLQLPKELKRQLNGGKKKRLRNSLRSFRAGRSLRRRGNRA